MRPENKGKIKGLTAGLLAGALLAGGGVFAASRSQNIEVFYDSIKIFVDGEQVDAKDANGETVEPFIYNGTTYLPVRAVGTAIGKEVSWDGVEKVVYLGAKPGETANWLDVCGPYQYSAAKEYRLVDNSYFTMSGKKYTNGFTFNGYTSIALFNLDGKYKSLTFTAGHVDGSTLTNAKLNVYLDGIIAYTADLKYDDVAKKITIPLNGALQMKIELVNKKDGISPFAVWGFSEGVFE